MVLRKSFYIHWSAGRSPRVHEVNPGRDPSRKISSNFETVEVGTFFKASRFEYRKMIFDATKVTYNMYSCFISGMSREMLKMDGRDSVEYQNWEKEGHSWY